MKYAFGPAGRQALARFARSNVLLAFDFDGTLAPIVKDPRTARMRRHTRALLATLIDRYPVAVISGRARHDVCRRLEGIRVRAVVGNHGLETAVPLDEHARLVRGWIPALTDALEGRFGIEIEDKGSSIALHYRRSRMKNAARRHISSAVARLGSSVRIVGGKQVVNLLPKGGAHKGTALKELRRALGVDAAVYVGDDTTDEDVFALDAAEPLLTVRVGRSQSSSAEYYLRAQHEISRLLGYFIFERCD